MEYDTKTHFIEHEEDDVTGFTIIGRDENEGYHIAEKWSRDDNEKDPVWVQYWLPEARLERRVENGECEVKGMVTDEQYQKVCELVGFPTEDERTAAPA